MKDHLRRPGAQKTFSVIYLAKRCMQKKKLNSEAQSIFIISKSVKSFLSWLAGNAKMAVCCLWVSAGEYFARDPKLIHIQLCSQSFGRKNTRLITFLPWARNLSTSGKPYFEGRAIHPARRHWFRENHKFPKIRQKRSKAKREQC